MRVIESPTMEKKEQLQMSIQSAMEYINAYKRNPDDDRLKKCLCKVIDTMPDIAYLDEDVLECHGIDSDLSQWVELDEQEAMENKEQLKSHINGKSVFDTHDLSFESSGSLMRVMFGESFDLI